MNIYIPIKGKAFVELAEEVHRLNKLKTPEGECCHRWAFAQEGGAVCIDCGLEEQSEPYITLPEIVLSDERAKPEGFLKRLIKRLW
jgi:hypothetical protein